MGLLLRDELAQPVVLPLDLVHDATRRRRVVAGDQVRVALAVVGRLDPPHRPVDAAAQRSYASLVRPPEYVVIECVDRSIAVCASPLRRVH